jgi:hypothetical protein
MARDLTKFRDWLNDNKAGLNELLGAASMMIEVLAPVGAGANTTVRDMLSDDPVTVRALLDAHNLAGIAGHANITPEKLIEALGQVLGVVTLVTAVL